MGRVTLTCRNIERRNEGSGEGDRLLTVYQHRNIKGDWRLKIR